MKEDRPANFGKTWTVEDMFRLSELYLEPITWRTIAEKLQRTVPACQARLHLVRLACELSRDVNADKILGNIAKQPKIRRWMK